MPEQKQEQKEQFQDKTIVCSDCGNEFTFTAGEQEFFQSKSFDPPKRCKECRDRRRADNNANIDRKVPGNGGYGKQDRRR